MGSHSVTCHPTEVRIPPLPPAEAGTQFSDPEGMQGWVNLCYVKTDWPGIEPATRKSQVQRPTALSPRNVKVCEIKKFQTAKVTFKVTVTGNAAIWPATHDFLLLHCNYVSIFTVSDILSLISQNLNRSRDSERITFGVIYYASMA